jgi:hypothetical protein
MIGEVALGLSLVATGVSVLALGFGCYALVKTVAMEKSTHTIQWKDPFAEEELPTDEELNKKLHEDFEVQQKSSNDSMFEYERQVLP